MNNLTPWHETDAFWETFAPLMFGERRWANTPAEIDGILNLMNLAPGTTILDLCCGPGRHALELARRGFQVTGVDRTAAYLEQARLQAQEERLSIQFIEADMRYFVSSGAFDAALLMFTSFGYFQDPAENRQVLVNVCDSLREGGRVILDLMGKEILARIFKERDWVEVAGDIYLEERKISRDWSRVENRWIALRGTERSEFTVAHWLYSAAELTALLKESGFKSVDIYGSIEGDPYDHNAQRLIVVGQK